MKVSGQIHAPTALLPEKQPHVPIVQEARREPEPVLTLWRRETSLLVTGNQTRLLGRPFCSTVAIPAPYELMKLLYKYYQCFSRKYLVTKKMFPAVRQQPSEASNPCRLYIQIQFVPRRKHITPLLQKPIG
jgi:hypothetical protein